MKIKKIFILFLLFIISLVPMSYADNTEDIHIYSDAVILIENKTGKILYEKNSDQKMFPASTTKILTAIITIEKGNLQDEVTVTKTALAEMKSGYSSAYLVEGEIMSVENLLKVLLIHSANDASNVLAEYISGSIPEFVNLMNSKAQEIGCTNTHFVTTNGLHDDNHYTTANDLAKIARYCMQNETFRNIVSTPRCTIPATNKSQERYYKNTNDMLITNSGYYYPNCIGIKTGYTSQAKNCLISAASKDGLQLIGVVLGADVTETNKSARYVDSKALFDYAYSNYSVSNIAKQNDIIQTIEIKNGTKETKSLDLILDEDITALVHKNTNTTVAPEITLNEDLSAPISANTVIGTATYTIDGQSYTQNLLASHDVEKIDFLFIYLIIGLILVVLILFFTILLTSKRKKRSKHLRK